MFEEAAPAKINLAQDILFKRTDDYHEVEMVMASVDIIDHLTFTPFKTNEIVVHTDREFIPNDSRNHAYKAAHLLKETFSINEGIQIDIAKRIPVSAGLGGGSTNAAATLRALNRIWRLNRSTSELQLLASQIGSDVPYSITGGTAYVTGMGEKVESIGKLPNCWVIIAKPNISVSTRKVFQALDIDRLTYTPNADRVRGAVLENDYEAMVQATGNSLEEVTFSLFPKLIQLKEKMIKFGAEGVTMSGSGPSIIGFSSVYSKAKRIQNALNGFCKDVYVVRSL